MINHSIQINLINKCKIIDINKKRNKKINTISLIRIKVSISKKYTQVVIFSKIKN